MNPERYAPQKIDLAKIQQGLSQRQMKKILYECDLLRMDPQKLLYVAPHLFVESVTAANTPIIKEEVPPIAAPSIDEDNEQSSYHDDYDFYSP